MLADSINGNIASSCTSLLFKSNYCTFGNNHLDEVKTPSNAKEMFFIQPEN